MARKFWLPYIIEPISKGNIYYPRLYRRFELGQDKWGVMVWFSTSQGKWRHTYQSITAEGFETPEEAMALLDEYLVSRGDYLIPEDKVELLSVLP